MLIIPIKEKWFHMILAGVKKEEYREREEYWRKRFEKYFGWRHSQIEDRPEEFAWQFSSGEKEVVFRNGY